YLLLCSTFHIPRPPLSTLFPYTTLFRSLAQTVSGRLLSGATPPVSAEESTRYTLRLLETRGQRLRCLAGLYLTPSEAGGVAPDRDRKSTRLNSSHVAISYAVFCLKKKKN